MLTLRLTSTPVRDIAPIARLPRLRNLDIGPAADILHRQYERSRRKPW